MKSFSGFPDRPLATGAIVSVYFPCKAGLFPYPGVVDRGRLEWLRLSRTPRAPALAAVYLIFGLGKPAVAKYLNTIIRHAGGADGLKITAPPPIPLDGIKAFLGEADLIGLLVVVVIAVGAFGFDAKPGLATFMRTRTRGMWQLVAPSSRSMLAPPPPLTLSAPSRPGTRRTC
ncbi:MAG TPA: hypothetical protein VFQ44_30605 [Streptosporangiaceae bacterium]|nr:hypothetical protein [Streptosporangiaceae bacterium]